MQIDTKKWIYFIEYKYFFYLLSKLKKERLIKWLNTSINNN